MRNQLAFLPSWEAVVMAYLGSEATHMAYLACKAVGKAHVGLK